MKNLANLITAACAAISFLSLSPAYADEKEHKHEAKAGPNGGKVIHEVVPHAELFVTKDRKIQVTILDEKGKATAPGEQSIAVVCGKRNAPTRMRFAKKGNSFLSDKPLPKGMNIPTIVRFKMSSKAKAITVRFNLNLEDCPSCDYLEYACTCHHGEEGDHDHEHEKKKK